MVKEATEFQEGDVIEFTLTGTVSVGDVIPLGTSMIGIACTSGLSGEIISIKIEDVYEINASTSDAIAIGDEVFFDVTNRVITTTATSNVRAGRAVSGKASAVAGIVAVKLNAA